MRYIIPVLCTLSLAFGSMSEGQLQGTALPSSGVALNLGGGLAAGGAISDIFVGRNVVGPYLLTWKAIDGGTETVTRGGQKAARDTDYILDPAAGVVKFTQPLKTGEIARVDYRLVPGKSQANRSGAIPMQFKLFDRNSAGLSMSAILTPGAAPAGQGTSSPGGMMLLGLAGNAIVGKESSLTSKLYLDARGGSLSERGAFQFGDTTKTRLGKFDASISRAGAGFLAGQATGIQAGQQIIDTSAALNPIMGIRAAATFKQVEDLPENGHGTTTTILGQRLSGKLGSAQFQASRTTTSTDNPDGTGSTRVADRIQLDQKIIPSTSATALFERGETSGSGQGSVTQTSTLQLRSQPVGHVTLVGIYQNQLLPAGAQDSTSLKVEADATKQIKLGALFGDKFKQAGASHQREATLEYSPDKKVSITGVVQARADGATEELARGFTASARPIKLLEFSGGVKMRDSSTGGVEDKDTPDTYDAKMSLNLLQNALKLTAGYSNNPEDDKGVITRANSRTVGLTSTLGRVDLAGGYSIRDEYMATRLSTILDLRLGWKFLPASQIVTSYKGATTVDTALLQADTYTLSLVHRVGTLLDLALSGSMTTYEKDRILQPLKDYKAEARLGLHF